MYSLNHHIKKSGVLIIAEIGNNHDGCLSKACALIDIAADSGADLVKFQTFRGRDIVTPLVKSSDYPDWNVKEFAQWHEFLDSIALSYEDHIEAFKYARKKGITAFSTPTSPGSLEFLEEIGCPLYKVASMDLTNVRLLRAIKATGKPAIVSTGMSSEQDVQNALEIFDDAELVLMHCISDYPLSPKDANLCSIKRLSDLAGDERYVGFSDHSLGYDLSLVALGAGARVFEKHITYDRESQCRAEHHFSLNPNELCELVSCIRLYHSAMGEQALQRSRKEKENKLAYRRSIHVNSDLKCGHVLDDSNIEILRPGDGAEPSAYYELKGKKLIRDIKAWEPLDLEDVI